MATTYTVRRGETLTLYLEAVSGDPATATGVVAKIKPDPIGNYDVAGTVLATTLQAVRVSADVGPGWYVALPATLTAVLITGNYSLDLAFHVGAGEFVSETIGIEILDAVSVP